MHLTIAQQNTKFHLLFASTKEILGKQNIINLNMNGKQTICFIKVVFTNRSTTVAYLESLIVNNKSGKFLVEFIEKLRSSKNYFQNKKN